MTNLIESIVLVRRAILASVENMDNEALNKVPAGFNNNIAWNLGHLVAAQQGICYLRSGAVSPIGEEHLVPYRPGTRPEGVLAAEEIDRIKNSLISSVEKIAADLETGVFANYTTWTTRVGVTITSIEDALRSLLFHEGLHFGYILSLKKFL